MKPLRSLLICTCLSLSFFIASAQDKKTTSTDYTNPIGDGKWSFRYMQNGYYSNTKTLVNDVEVSKSNSIGANLHCDRYFKGGFGAGLDLNLNSSGSHYTNTDDLNRSWSVSPSLLWGTPISSDKLYGRFRAGVTFGNDKDIYQTSSNSTPDKASLFGFNGEAGVLWRIKDNSFLAPNLVYRNLTSTYDNRKEKDNSFGLLLGLENFLHCGELSCDHKNHYTLSKDAYHQGSSYLDYNTDLSVLFGNNELTYDIPPGGTYENKYNNVSLNGGYSYYIIDYVAIGAQLNVGSMVQKSDDNTFKYTWNNFAVEPSVTVNTPVDNGFRNLFLQAGYNIGSDKYEVKSGSNTTTSKYSSNGYKLCLGWNSFLADHVSFTSRIGYGSTTNKDKNNNNNESVNKGLFIDGGLRLNFNN